MGWMVIHLVSRMHIAIGKSVVSSGDLCLLIREQKVGFARRSQSACECWGALNRKNIDLLRLSFHRRRNAETRLSPHFGLS
jgi:hypothetical protein